MSFDQAIDTTPSTLDGFSFERSGARVRRRAPKLQAASATVDAELDQPTVGSSASGLDDVFVSDRPYVIEGDVSAFKRWMLRTGSGALLEVVAHTLRHRVNATAVKAVLDVESNEDERIERAVLLAVVSPDQSDALENLFSFTASDWWLALSRATDNTLLVDIQRG